MTIEVVESVVGSWDGVESGRMFGLPSFTVEDRLFALVDADRLVITNLTEAGREELASRAPVEPFVTDGLTVARWAVVSLADLDVAEPYLRRSYEAARRR
ncbi:hypothetical protein [Haloarchaeobius amylolyticus]|uniref:hypothetical protein n=1 Tax=Haloarchaeobius amylolyticus TaxID=1198296 RepID=UPI0022709039|nr:hypothetical protein [Haloarchaeobius amylolyticus]